MRYQEKTDKWLKKKRAGELASSIFYYTVSIYRDEVRKKGCFWFGAIKYRITSVNEIKSK